jgi:hypothetical protein
LAAPAAMKLGEMGASAKDTIPHLISALTGQDQTKRQQIEDAIHKIDPSVEIRKVNSGAIAKAAKIARLTLEGSENRMQLASLAQLLQDNQEVNSEWRAQEELVILCKQVAAQDQDTYRVFVNKLTELEPNLTNLFAEPTSHR